jgi:hypothetical protein
MYGDAIYRRNIFKVSSSVFHLGLPHASKEVAMIYERPSLTVSVDASKNPEFMAGKRRSLSLPPNVKSGSLNARTMLVLTNGTVLVNNSRGSSGLESNMTNARFFYSSGVLPDGHRFVVGGEFSDPGTDMPLAEIFDPVAFTRPKDGDSSVRTLGSHLTHVLEVLL